MVLFNVIPAVLEFLIKHEGSDVREKVAGNPNIPVASLEVLAQDENEEVREAVARNPNCPDHLKP